MDPKKLLLTASILFFQLPAAIPSRADAYEEYILKYADLAIEQQQEFGIPASITLAQGILESSAGRSTLATQGNNHFGIKCHRDWKGKTMLRDDDLPNECFRVYDTPAQSYRDHSLFLKRDRYRPLYDFRIEDYKSWATGLKKCGYATDPNYAERLITIIERYALYNYDSGFPMQDEIAEYILENLSASHVLRKSNGLHYVVALPGDTYKSLAKEFGIKEKQLRAYNDADKKTALKEWEEIYLQPKNNFAPEGVTTATIGDGENMRSIAQRYGMKMETIKTLNKKAKDRPGTILRLR